MQDNTHTEAKKKLIKQALANTMKELRGTKSQFLFASENDISSSIISSAERGIKDPQLTTLFKIAEGYDMNIVEFIARIYEKLPKNFEMIDK